MTKNEWMRLKGYLESKRITNLHKSRNAVKSAANGTGQILKKSFVKSISISNPSLKGEYKTLKPYSFVPYPKDKPDTLQHGVFSKFNTKVKVRSPIEHGQYVLTFKFENNHPESGLIN